jgi:hypothetical protein
MPNLKQVQPPARYRGELLNRQLNWALAQARAFGTSAVARIRALRTIVRAKANSSQAITPKPPQVPKGLKTAGPWRRRPKQPRMRPVEAEIDLLMADSRRRAYAKLTNGQVVRCVAELRPGSLRVPLPVGATVLNPASVSGLPVRNFPRP